MSQSAEYDPRYLLGIVHFNRGDYFEAHEVWEDLWHDTAGPDRRFYQGLIQAAVAVYHAGNGNARGARASPANVQIAACLDGQFATRALRIEDRNMAPVGNIEVAAQQCIDIAQHVQIERRRHPERIIVGKIE